MTLLDMQGMDSRGGDGSGSNVSLALCDANSFASQILCL